MARRIALALLAGVSACPLAVGAEPLQLRAGPQLDLPFGEDIAFPAGPGAEVAAANCLTCHSADHTLNQPTLSRVEWRKVVDKMITAYKAPIEPVDAAVIVDYLARIKGEP